MLLFDYPLAIDGGAIELRIGAFGGREDGVFVIHSWEGKSGLSNGERSPVFSPRAGYENRCQG